MDAFVAFEYAAREKNTDISDILPSVRARGILQPLLVRPNADGFEIVAGRRRYYCAKEQTKSSSDFNCAGRYSQPL
ncbi:MAG TPA: ParB/RepB/Spo0J family partition protein [Rhizomicrobium sp.]|nr:ParB/RepB/Spo0J family partition protein [Rhizomicrobium sp.]